MLILKKPDTRDLTQLTCFKTSCVNCTNEEIVISLCHESAVIALNKIGWRTYETDDEIGGNTCPSCVKELIAIEESEKVA